MTTEEEFFEFNQEIQEEKETPKETTPEAPGRAEAPEETTRVVNATDAQMWARHGRVKFSACEAATNRLPPGQYTIGQSSAIGIYFHKKDVYLDDLMELPDSASEEILKQVESFWQKEKHFRKFGFLWKRGIMLWGPPGGGKTCTLQLISKHVIDNGGIAVYVTYPGYSAIGLELLRKIEPDRKLVVMIEDIDAMIREWGEADLLAMLDGELQIDNVLFIATTNYPERLDRRFKNRPSRFDYVKKIGMPTNRAREIYLSAKNERLVDDPMELEKWVAETEGLSIAHLKELITSVEVFEVPFQQAIERLRAMSNHISSEQDSDRQVGFVRHNN